MPASILSHSRRSCIRPLSIASLVLPQADWSLLVIATRKFDAQQHSVDVPVRATHAHVRFAAHISRVRLVQQGPAGHTMRLREAS